MATRMTPQQAAAWLRQRAARLRENVTRAERANLVSLHAACERRSQGPLQPADLRRMDHPYARRHGAPLLNPDIVNKNTGAFAASWQMEGPEAADGGLHSSVWNSDPVARYLSQEEGDEKTTMFKRRPHEAAAAEIAPLREERLARAIQESYQG